MFAGHLGAGLILKRADIRVNLGALFFGAMLLDFVLWTLVLLGVESVHIPGNYRRATDISFNFPYSHGLLASLLWAGAGCLATCILLKHHPCRVRAGLTIAVAIFSHFLLDWLVHQRELPLAGSHSAKIGLGLWQHLPLAWTVEVFLMLIGLALYARTERLAKGKFSSLLTVMFLVTLLTIVGQASSTQPPNSSAMAGSSLFMIVALTAFGWWVERKSTTIT